MENVLKVFSRLIFVLFIYINSTNSFADFSHVFTIMIDGQLHHIVYAQKGGYINENQVYFLSVVDNGRVKVWVDMSYKTLEHRKAGSLCTLENNFSIYLPMPRSREVFPYLKTPDGTKHEMNQIAIPRQLPEFEDIGLQLDNPQSQVKVFLKEVIELSKIDREGKLSVEAFFERHSKNSVVDDSEPQRCGHGYLCAEAPPDYGDNPKRKVGIMSKNAPPEY